MANTRLNYSLQTQICIGEFVLKIRLKRVGGKNKPSYRIVLADSREARDGSFIEQLGLYDPKTDPPTIVIDTEKTQEWIAKGAQTTDSVSRIIKTHENQSNQKDALDTFREIIMNELLEFIVRSIASNPDEVKVTESREDNGNKVLIQLEVSPDDKRKVIGTQGRGAQSKRP